MKTFEVATEVIKAQTDTEKMLERIANRMDEINKKTESISNNADISDIFQALGEFTGIVSEFEHEVQGCYDILQELQASGKEDVSKEISEIETYLNALKALKDGFSV